MAELQPRENEYQRALNVAARNKARSSRGKTIPNETFPFHIFKPMFAYTNQRIVEFAVAVRNNDRYGKILAKSDFVLKEFSSDLLVLPSIPRRMVPDDWIFCPVCGRPWPIEERYWWVRSHEKNYFYLDACRECKCKTQGKRHRYRGNPNALLTVVNRVN